MEFHIEAFTSHQIHGWAYDPTPGASHVTITIPLQGGSRSVEASLYRQHLRDAGKGNGEVGFVFGFGRGERFDPSRPIALSTNKTERTVELNSPLRRAIAYDSAHEGLLSNPETIFDCVLVLIVKDESRYLEEWIEYHRLLGVDHFMIFDNGSTDGILDNIQHYVDWGLITFIEWPNLTDATMAQRRSGWLEQDTAYACAMRLLDRRARWAGCLDVDEFVVFSKGEKRNLPEFLDSQEAPMVMLFWRLFGTSGIESPTGRLVIEEFINRGPDTHERASKVFVKPEEMHCVINAHRFVAGSDRLTGHTTSGESSFGSEPLRPCYSGATVHHYHTRSRQEFIAKVQRGWPANDDSKNFNWEKHFSVHDRNDICDTSAALMAPEVARRIALSRKRREVGEEPIKIAHNWLLTLPPTILFHSEVSDVGGRLILEGFLIDLLQPNKSYEIAVHDGIGKLYGVCQSIMQSQILSMARISHSAYGFQFDLPMDAKSTDRVFLTSEVLSRSIRLPQ